MRTQVFRLPAFLVFFVGTVVATSFFAANVFSVRSFSVSNISFYILLAGHCAMLLWWLLRKDGQIPMACVEALLCLSVVFFCFSFFYAKNANMDYVQRFMLSGGDLKLDSDGTQQRWLTLLKYGPFLLASVGCYAYMVRYAAQGSWIDRYAVLLVLGSALLSAYSFPSALFREGLPLLAWVSMTPLYLCLRELSFRRGFFLSVFYGVCLTLFAHYWLATFSLVSLQAAVAVLFFYYLLCMPFVVFLLRRSRGALIPALLWTLFSYLQYFGFAAFPWATPAHSQFRTLALIQIASICGIWGVTFVLCFANAGIAEYLRSFLPWRRHLSKRRWQYLLAPALVALAVLVFGWSRLAAQETPGETLRVALVQNNGDPRKHSYRETLQTLATLTNETLASNPDIIIWPETAFVPNIRRWGQEDPERYPLAALVRTFRRYQENTGTWLLTGNDDYEFTVDEDGEIINRREYNAAVLFAPDGSRIDTYRKIKLVPFTETFPYKETFPWIHQILLDFDVNFWEAGARWVVFPHPKFKFSVLICFEDSFPYGARRMVREGAEVLVNLSNDYWAQDETEAMQHFAASVFRAVENARPLLRATTSGVTSYVDAYGRLRASLPTYEEDSLVVKVSLEESSRRTLYTRFGDWFAYVCIGAAAILCGYALFGDYLRRRNAQRR